MLANINLKIGDEVGVNDDFLATVKGFKIATEGTVLVTVIDREDNVFHVRVTNLNKNDYEDYEPLITESKISRVIEGIDYKALREQKLALLKIITAIESVPGSKLRKKYCDNTIGLLHLLDAIQDAVVDDGIHTEKEVFDLEED